MSTATLKKFALTAAGTAFIALGAGTAEAATFNEVGDAGSTIPTAQDVGDGIDKIEGSLDTVGGIPDTDIFKLSYSKDVMFSAFNLVPFSIQFADIFLLDDTGSEVFSCLDCFFSEGNDGTEIFGGLLTAGEYFLQVSDRFSSQFGSYSVEITKTEVPEPASVLGLFTLGAMGVGSALKRNKKRNT